MEQIAGTNTVRILASYTRSEPSSRSTRSGGYVAVSTQFMFSTLMAVVVFVVGWVSRLLWK